ncbi:hypothetical protein [Thermoactinospora rubra]|uniref:hypothetical protein n=1 Tax=Thermoactinospora rubra TaxID=1088767 RepID=UPI000A11450D|nr:hypothetical protein [Thermoactinospora rubra]
MIVAVVFCGFGGIALAYVVASGKSAGEIVPAVACLPSPLSLQYFYSGRPGTGVVRFSITGVAHDVVYILRVTTALHPIILPAGLHLRLGDLDCSAQS